MSKFTKLVNNPKLYFKDALFKKKSIKLTEDSILLEDNVEDLIDDHKLVDYIHQLNSDSENDFSNYIKSQIAVQDVYSNLLAASYQYNLYQNNFFQLRNIIECQDKVYLDKLFDVSYVVEGIEIPKLFDYWNNYEKAHSFKDALNILFSGIKKCHGLGVKVDQCISEHNLTVLNSNAINSHLTENYISNSMYYELQVQNRSLDMLTKKRELYWWWLTYSLPINKLSSDFIPIEIRSFFSESDFFQEDLKLHLPKFLHYVFKDNELYQKRYSLTDKVGFLGFICDFYLHNFSNEINYIFLEGDISQLFSKNIINFTHSNVDYRCNILSIMHYMHVTEDVFLDDLTEDKLLASHHFIESKLTDSMNILDNGSVHLEVQDTKCTLVGLYYSSTGLAANLKMMSETLRSLRIAHDIYDIETQDIISVNVDNAVTLKQSLNIFMINADMIPERFLAVNNHNKNAFNIGFLLWELEYVPKNQKLALEVLDAIWVPTDYLLNVYQNVTDTPVIYVGKHVTLPSPTKKYKPKKDFSFYMSFDFHSNIERKNPVAAIKAFKLAFSNNENVKFILKTTDILRDHPGNRKGQWENILNEINGDKRFKIISGRLPFQELVNQINSMDCIVSSHRSEGFGYLLAHAFILTKPVIVTDYSGTSDFCTKDNAYLVKWKKLDLDEGDFGPFVKSGFWADVDIHHMSEQMREVYLNQENAIAKAVKGKKLIETKYSLEQFTENLLHALKGESIV